MSGVRARANVVVPERFGDYGRRRFVDRNVDGKQLARKTRENCTSKPGMIEIAYTSPQTSLMLWIQYVQIKTVLNGLYVTD